MKVIRRNQPKPSKVRKADGLLKASGTDN